MLIGSVEAPLSRWDVKFYSARVWRDMGFPLVPLGEIAHQVRVPSDDPDVPLGSIHFDGTITARAQTSLKGVTFLAEQRQLVFSQIDAVHGAIAVVPDGQSFRFSSEYPIYEFDPEGRVDPRYAALICRSDVFLSHVRAKSTGHTGRKRVYPAAMETILLPLPDIETQRRIVKEYADAVQEAADIESEATHIREDALDKALAILGLVIPHLDPLKPGTFAVDECANGRWSVRWNRFALSGALEPAPSTKFEMTQLGHPDVASIAYGISKSPANRPSKNAVPYLRVANVQEGALDLSDLKLIEVKLSDLPKYRLEVGDILLCEGNSLERVGRPAMWRGEVPVCVHQNHILRVRPNTSEFSPEFLLVYLMTRAARNHLLARAKQTTNLANINSTDVSTLPVPRAPKYVQKEVCDLVMAAEEERTRRLAKAEEVRRKAWLRCQEQVGGRIKI